MSISLTTPTSSPDATPLSSAAQHTRDRIIEAMLELMTRQGYGATSIKHVAEAALAPTGSLYHHFPGGKQQIATAALRKAGAEYSSLVPARFDPHPELAQGVHAFFDTAAVDQEHAEWVVHCPVGSVAAEVAGSEPALREVCAQVIAEWVDRSCHYFQSRGLTPSAARAFALAVHESSEGAYILCRTLGSTEPLLTAANAMLAYLATLTAPSGAASDPEQSEKE